MYEEGLEQKSKQELMEMVTELRIFNQQLLEDQRRETRMHFAWTGNLGRWYLHVASGSVVFNPLKVENLGFQLEELSQRVHYSFFTERIHPADYEQTMESMRNVITGRSRIYEAEYRIRTKDGDWHWFYDRGAVTECDAQGHPVVIAGIVFDTSEQKKRETALKEEREALLIKTARDSMTGLRNRDAILEELHSRVSESRDYGTPLSLIFLDIDHFKRINDTCGHLYGDSVITAVGDILSQYIRGVDSAGRYGGEEFLVILPNTSLDAASGIAEKIRAVVGDHPFGKAGRVTISGGVASWQGQEDAMQFLKRADAMMYRAKDNGRDCIVSQAAAGTTLTGVSAAGK